ncbi:hypothetical protein [Enterocloster citroniae]
MLAIQIEYGDVKSEELVFPLNDKEKDIMYSMIESSERAALPLTIYSSRSSVQTLPSCIHGLKFNKQSPKELMFLQERLDRLTATEQDILSGILEIEKPKTLKEIINLSYHLRNYELLKDSSDSGRMAAELLMRDKKIEVPEEIWPLLDFEWIRDRFFDTHQGAYCPSGLVLKCEGAEVTEMYQDYFPDPGYEKDGAFLIHLYKMSGGQPVSYSVSLPADAEKLEMARRAMGIQDFSECKMSQYGGPLDQLKRYLPVAIDVESLNQFAIFLRDQVMADERQSLNVLMAALEAECPRNMEEALNVVSDLSRYQIFEDIQSPEDYARFKMTQDGSVYASPICESYLNFRGLGEALLKRDGVMMTNHGLVICDRWCCERLPDDVVVTRLFSPLSGTYENEEGYQSSFSAMDLAGYEFNIRKAIEVNFIQENPKGLAEYLNNQLVKRRVISMFPTVENYRYQLWGVLEVKSRGELRPEEWTFIKEEWTGQTADGWGEVFEQEEINCGEGDTLYVHFYTGEMDIRTEEELKGITEEQSGVKMRGMI